MKSSRFPASHVALLFAAGTLFAIGSARADITLPAVFSDHMVLQRGGVVPVWGWADAGEEVAVTFGAQTKSTKAGRSVVAAAREALAHITGGKVPVRETSVWTADVKDIRRGLDMSQQDFADAFGIPLRTVQSWEQGARQPDATARSYLRTIAKFPRQVRSAMRD